MIFIEYLNFAETLKSISIRQSESFFWMKHSKYIGKNLCCKKFPRRNFQAIEHRKYYPAAKKIWYRLLYPPNIVDRTDNQK